MIRRLLALALFMALAAGCSRAESACEVTVVRQEGNISGITAGAAGERTICVAPQEFNIYGTCKRAEGVITITNKNSAELQYSITYTTLPKLHKGYSPAPADARNWVTFSDNNINIEAGQQRDINVSLGVPQGIVTPDKWEFAVEIKDLQGMAVNMRWLVDA